MFEWVDKMEAYMDRREAENRAAIRRVGAWIKARPTLKTTLMILGIVFTVACVISLYGIMLLVGVAAIVLGLAAKA